MRPSKRQSRPPGRRAAWSGFLAVGTLLASGPSVLAQTAPTIDTEDASLGSVSVVAGWVHPTLSFDVRNGDFARGQYDDDAANLDRAPVHAQAGAAFELHRRRNGVADAWLVVTSSNGFHKPGMTEVMNPRGWYESNNLAGLVVEMAPGLRAGLAYAIKTSPNLGSIATTHEASATFAYEADEGLGALKPNFAVTFRPRGGPGVFTQFGIEPEFELGSGESAPSLSLPARFGVGWDGFYQEGAGDALYGAAGAAFSQPFEAAGAKWTLRAEALALVRDKTLKRLAEIESERQRVVPQVTLGISLAY